MMAAQNASTSPSNDPVSLRCCDQPLHGAARFGDVRRQSEHVEILLVADDDARRGVVEHEALRNIVDGGAKMAPFGGQRSIEVLMTPEQQTDGERQDAGDGKQRAVEKAPGRQRDTGQDRGNAAAPQRPSHCSCVMPSAESASSARQSRPPRRNQFKLVRNLLMPPPIPGMLARYKWKWRYDFELALRKMDRRAFALIAPAHCVAACRPLVAW